ncbi:hypothetical protein AB1285_23975 [Microbacterium sp. NRRL B-14842]|uniref:FlgK family flagellar hook-associated protein n=1 Tax=Microbacterium sp. NRRL B-14842 TaxID=3162881 RepID=UPI003D289FD8
MRRAASILESAKELAAHISGGYRTVAAQWTAARGTAERTVSQVNAAADQIAVLNSEIREALASGRSANELHRPPQPARGGRGPARRRDGHRGDGRHAHGPPRRQRPGLRRRRPSHRADRLGDDRRRSARRGRLGVGAGSSPRRRRGELGGSLAVLAPAADGGMLAQLAATYDRVATALAESLNAQHRAGVTASGQPGGDFFTLPATGSAALGMQVAVSTRPTSPSPPPGPEPRTRPTPTSSPRSGSARPLRTHCGPIR